MENVSLPSSRIVNTSSSAQDKYIEETGMTHTHGPEGEHAHAGYAFTTWLDFGMAINQAEAIKDELVKRLPENRETIETNHQQLADQLTTLNTSMLGLSAKFDGKTIIGSHPVYQYLAEAYDLDILSVHFEPGEMPSTEQWKDFDHLLGHHPAAIMIWEDQPIPEISNILLDKGMEVLVFNPCGNRPVTGDFIDAMKKNILTLEKAVNK
jgi:zinc transport system substrate-binding protein